MSSQDERLENIKETPSTEAGDPRDQARWLLQQLAHRAGSYGDNNAAYIESIRQRALAIDARRE